MLSDIMSRMVETVADQGEDMQVRPLIKEQKEIRRVTVTVTYMYYTTLKGKISVVDSYIECFF